LTQYAIISAPHSLFGGVVAGKMIRRQTSRSATAMIRKKGASER
jgi:hypothetical protein